MWENEKNQNNIKEEIINYLIEKTKMDIANISYENMIIKEINQE